MRIITAPTPETLRTLGLNPNSGVAESVSGGSRRSTMLAWHLNRWILGKAGGSVDRPWLVDLSGLSADMVADFGEHVRRYDRALKEAGAEGADAFGWEFLLSARLWKSARNISGILVLHAGFEEECRRLARETGLPMRLTDPLLRTWLLLLFRCSSPECPVTLVSIRAGDLKPMAVDTLLARESAAEPLAPSELNATDPLPHGAWCLVKGGWDVVANDADLEVAGALQRIDREWRERETQLCDQILRDTRLVELRGIGRVEDARAQNLSRARNKRFSSAATAGSRRLLIHLGQYVRHHWTRMFRKKIHQKDS